MKRKSNPIGSTFLSKITKYNRHHWELNHGPEDYQSMSLTLDHLVCSEANTTQLSPTYVPQNIVGGRFYIIHVCITL